ncbi:MAG: cell division protein FtsX [Alphaproteobacteria bacterium]
MKKIKNINDIKFNKDEIPLKGDSSNLFLEVMISISVFLFGVTLAGVLAINSMLSNWSDSILGALTVQIIPVNNVNKEKAIEETLIHQKKAIELLKTIDGIESVTPLEDKQLQKLLKPWLGDGIDLQDLPIPRLIDVKVRKNAAIDFKELAKKLADVSPLASLDSHKLWLAKLIEFADGLKNLALVTLALVLSISAGGIVYTTKSSLGLHKYVINILHIMGAKDAYIAKQFARRIGYISFIGGLIGIAFAVPTIFVISKLSESIEGGIISEASLSAFSWASILSLPLFSAGIAMVTAYYTVKKTLEKMM